MNNLTISSFMKPNRIKLLYIIGALFFVTAFFCGLFLGSTHLSIPDILRCLTEGFNASPETRVFAYIRLPRTVASLICGCALSVSGAVIQNVLANRLASPSIIGVNSGAGLAVTLCTAFGIMGGWQLTLFSFLGAFITVIFISLCLRKWRTSTGTVILLGVAINSFLGAISDTVITFIPEVGVMSNDFKIGEFTTVTYPKLIPAIIIITVTVLLLLSLSKELDILTLGEDSAKSLGMNTSVMRTIFLLLGALLAGSAVCLAGLLSFVGLIVPHTVRRFAGNSSCHLIGLSAIFGGGFVCMCDTLSRTVFSPYEIPVGIIMAFLGAPFFISVLIKQKGGSHNA